MIRTLIHKRRPDIVRECREAAERARTEAEAAEPTAKQAHRDDLEVEALKGGAKRESALSRQLEQARLAEAHVKKTMAKQEGQTRIRERLASTTRGSLVRVKLS